MTCQNTDESSCRVTNHLTRLDWAPCHSQYDDDTASLDGGLSRLKSTVSSDGSPFMESRATFEGYWLWFDLESTVYLSMKHYS